MTRPTDTNDHRNMQGTKADSGLVIQDTELRLPFYAKSWKTLISMRPHGPF